MKSSKTRRANNAAPSPPLPFFSPSPPARPLATRTHTSRIGTRVRYIGPGADDSDAAAVRSNRPCPRSSGIYYFEIEIIDRGRDGYIGMGFSGGNVNMQRLPGWDCHSYGYHGDDGNVFEWSGRGRSYGPVFGTGDTIGASLDWVTRSISFYKNGVCQGVAFVDVYDERLYATVGCRTPGEEIDANFGDREFMVDYAEMHRAAVRRTMASIMLSSPRPILREGDEGPDGGAAAATASASPSAAASARPPNRERADVGEGHADGVASMDLEVDATGSACFVGMLNAQPFIASDRSDAIELYQVTQYLLYNGYTESAVALLREAFPNATDGDFDSMVSAEALHAARRRSRAMQCVVSGDIEEAMRIVEELCPGMMTSSQDACGMDGADSSREAMGASEAETEAEAVAARDRTEGGTSTSDRRADDGVPVSPYGSGGVPAARHLDTRAGDVHPEVGRVPRPGSSKRTEKDSSPDDSDAYVVFRLKCLRLVQLLEKGDDSSALNYFRKELSQTVQKSSESMDVLLLRDRILALMALKTGSSAEQEKLEFARSRPALAESLNRSIIRLAGMDTQRARGRPREPRVDGGDPGEFEILEGNPTDGCDLEFVATDSMSCLERMIRFTAALLGTMKQLDDPEVSLAAELDLLPESCCAGLRQHGFVLSVDTTP